MDGRNTFLIPANSKKSQLIFGFFTLSDLILLIVGVALSFILLAVIETKNLFFTILLAVPGILAALLVAPVPNYHNVRTLLGNIYRFAMGRRRYYWRGWCARYDREDK